MKIWTLIKSVSKFSKLKMKKNPVSEKSYDFRRVIWHMPTKHHLIGICSLEVYLLTDTLIKQDSLH